jgi:hypothetical protein
MPLPGITLLIVMLGHRAIVSIVKRQAGIAYEVAFGIAYLYLTISLAVRLPRFERDETLWAYETTRNDACLEGYSYLAGEAYKAGNLALALKNVDRALRPKGNDLFAFVNTSRVLYYRGMIRFASDDVQGARRDFTVLLGGTDATLRGEAAYSLSLLAAADGNFVQMDEYLTIALEDISSPESRLDAVLLKSYANMRLNRLEQSARFFAEYRRASGGRSPESGRRAALVREVASGLGP